MPAGEIKQSSFVSKMPMMKSSIHLRREVSPGVGADTPSQLPDEAVSSILCKYG